MRGRAQHVPGPLRGRKHISSPIINTLYMNIKMLGVAVVSLILLMTSCNEDQPFQPDFSKYTALKVHLTDNPTDLEAVNIDLQSVIIVGKNERDTVALETEAGIYNLLDYQNGLQTIIANSIVDVDFVKEIRLILGEENSVVAGGETFFLKIPSGSRRGLKIKTCLDLSGVSDYDLLLDFDAEASVHQNGNGEYVLKPVIKVMNEDATCEGDDPDGDEEEEEEENGDDGLSVEDLPQKARDWLADNYDGWEFKVEKEDICGFDDEFFEVTAELEDHQVRFFFAEDGTLTQSMTPIQPGALPEPVSEAVHTQYPAYEISESNLFEISRGDDAKLYEVGLDRKGNGSGLTVTFDDIGGILCEIEMMEDEE